MEGRLIACCGLECTACPAFEASRDRDRAKAEATAAAWSRDYGVNVTVDDVWCDGCTAPGRKCGHCAECAIRTCAIARNLDTCAACPDYGCATLEAFLAMVPVARGNLEALRH